MRFKPTPSYSFIWSNRSIKLVLLERMQKWHPETDQITAPEKEFAWVAFWFVREVHWLELFMYLFMDVLINQPRNAGSSTSLTTSFAYGNHKFSHPPSTYIIFHYGFIINLFPLWPSIKKFTTNFVSGIEGLPASVSLQHSQTTSDALTLHFGFHGVVLLLLPTHLAIPGLWEC